MRPRRNTNLSISTLSSTSSPTEPNPPSPGKERFLWVPPPTDTSALPSPLIKHARETNMPWIGNWNRRIGVKHLLLVSGLVLLYLGYSCLELNGLAFDKLRISDSSRHFELVDGATFPDHPSTVLLHDERGRKRWTTFIPHTAGFPLQPQQYRDLCKSSEEVSGIVRESMRSSRIMGKAGLPGHGQSYYDIDRGYLDVVAAEKSSLLPSSESQGPVAVINGRNASELGDAAVCDRSLTFVMETRDAGFGNTLLALWLSYGLAKSEGRAFFLDDSRWSYGKYLSYFPMPPVPSCSPPPPSHILPCPHHVNHLVVSAATLDWTFNDKFHAFFHERRRNSATKQRQIYSMLRTGYTDLFHLIGEDASFLTHKLSVLRSNNNPVIGMHIRRGDRHPYELEFSNDYLPLERFTSTAQVLLHRTRSLLPQNSTTFSSPTLLLASDDPDIVESPDILQTLPSDLPTLSRAQDRIVLASKRTLEPAVPFREPGSAYTKHVDENSGWEGGFYAALFNSLGRQRGSTDQDLSDEAQSQAMALRALLGRAYLLDLAVLGRADGVACAVSSAACRVLGVMMGWESVVEERWLNVDDRRGWSWDGRK